MALPVWGLYMQNVYEDPRIGLEMASFERPVGVPNNALNCTEIKSDTPDEEGGNEDLDDFDAFD